MRQACQAVAFVVGGFIMFMATSILIAFFVPDPNALTWFLILAFGIAIVANWRLRESKMMQGFQSTAVVVTVCAMMATGSLMMLLTGQMDALKWFVVLGSGMVIAINLWQLRARRRERLEP